MRINSCYKKKILPETALLLLLILCLPVTGAAQHDKADDNNQAMQLQLILSPGEKIGNNITFSTDASRPTIKTKRRTTPYIDISAIQILEKPQETPLSSPVKTATTNAARVDLPTTQATAETNTLSTQLAEALQPETAKLDSTIPGAKPALDFEIGEKAEPVQQKKAVDSLGMSAPVKPTYLGFQPSFNLSTGYRNDELIFSIAPLGRKPNILSELTWENLDVFEIKGDAIWSNSSHLYLHGELGIGWIQGGHVIDSDYYSDNRKNEFSRAIADADGGSVMDGSIGLGYRFDLPLSAKGGRLQFIPMFGYGINVQDLTIRNGAQILAKDRVFPLPIRFSGLNSSYKASWKGPWLGFDVIVGFNDKHSLTGSFGYHWSSYDAEANWNLRTDFDHPISFKHIADGEGITGGLAYRYDFKTNWFWTMEFDFKKFSTEAGDDVTYFSDKTYSVIRLNEVEWESYSLLFGIGFTF